MNFSLGRILNACSPWATERRQLMAGRTRKLHRRFRAGALALALGATLASVSVGVPAGAIGSGGSTPFGLAPTPTASGQSRPYFEMTLAPGQSATDTVVISNSSKSTETLKVSPSTGITAPNTGTAFDGYFTKCVGVGCWVTGLPAAVTLAAGTSKELGFTVRVPAGTPLQQYLAGITAEPKNAPAPVSVGTNGNGASAKAIIINQVTVAVAVTVGTLSQMTTRIEIPGITGSAVGSTPRLNIGLRNTGQTFTKGTGTAICTIGGRQVSFPLTMDTVLPGDGATLPVNAPGLPAGTSVPCTVQLGYGTGQTATSSDTVAIPSTTPTTIVHTGPGVYATLPVGGIPTWAILVIVIGGLLLLTLMTLVVLLLRRRGRNPAVEDGPTEES
jgi:hypothetical protein